MSNEQIKDEKIIEHLTRSNEGSANTGISISTIAALPIIDTFPDDTLMEVSLPLGGNKYVSKAISWSTIALKLNHTADQFNSNYSSARRTDLGASATVYSHMANTPPWKWDESFPDPDEGDPPETPYVWNDVWSLTNGELQLKKDVEKVNETLETFNNSKPAFAPQMTFATTLNVIKEGGEMVSSDSTVPMSKAYQDPASGVNSDAFVLSFNKGNRITNTLTCKDDGMLILYGWVDSSEVPNVKYLPTCWCALEGNISGSWEILSLQPVMPAKQFSYIGFSVPVVKDLLVRCELGFVPGEASGRYDRTVAPSSLSNVRPNAFLGGVFSMKKTNVANQP